MFNASTLGHVSPQLLKVWNERKDAAVEEQGITRQEYGRELEKNLPDLQQDAAAWDLGVRGQVGPGR